MSHVINWNAVAGAAKYRVYRSTSKFDNTTLPTDTKDTADGNTLSMTYTDAVRNTVYWYMISSFDSNGNEVYGQIFNAGYFPDTGPGPQTLLRGDWLFGFFGEVAMTSLFTPAEIINLLKNAGYASLSAATAAAYPTLYAKVVVNGKILFIPNGAITSFWVGNGPQNNVTQTAPNGFPTSLASAPIFSKNGYDYMYRMPKCSLVDANYMNGAIPTYTVEDYLRSESSMVAALYNTSAITKAAANSANVANATVWEHLCDWTMISNLSNGVLSASGPGVMMLSSTGTMGYSYNATVYNTFVLELLF